MITLEASLKHATTVTARLNSISQSTDHLLAIITWDKNTENTISTNDRYNQAETALIVDIETQINQLHVLYKMLHNL